MNVDSFFSYLLYERRYSEKTVASYRIDLSQFVDFLGVDLCDVSWELVSVEDVKRWIYSMLENGYSAVSVNRKVSSLRSFYKYLRRYEGVASPVERFSSLKTSRKLPVFLRECEMDKLLDEMGRANDFEGNRDYLIVEMLYMTGIRLSELISLDKSDIDFSANVLRVYGKGKKQRLIPFDDCLRQDMLDFLGSKKKLFGHADGALFVDMKGKRISRSHVYQMVRGKLATVTQVKKKSPHVLRHTFATALLNNGANIESVKNLLGHSSLSATEVYTHITFDQLRKVYDQSHPRS